MEKIQKIIDDNVNEEILPPIHFLNSSPYKLDT